MKELITIVGRRGEAVSKCSFMGNTVHLTSEDGKSVTVDSSLIRK